MNGPTALPRNLPISPAAYTAPPASDDMTRYQLSIYRKIDEILAKSGVSGNDFVLVTISDAGFAAMKRDPAYEAWVLDTIRSACEGCSSRRYDSWTFLKFGASEAEFQKNTHTFPSRKTCERMREKERREKEALRRKRQKEYEKKLLEEKWRKQEIQRTYVRLEALDHRMQIEEENKALRFQRDYHFKDHSASNYAAAKRRAHAYEATFLYRDC